MNLDRIDRVPYCMDVFQKMVQENPDSVILTDDVHPCGWTRAEVDDLSGRVYHYLQKQGIGREDFVLIRMPRGGQALIAMIGVWKAGAALTVVEYDYAPERIEFIQKDCGCKLVIDPEVWKEIQNEDPLPGYTKAELHDAAFAVYTSGSSGTPKGVLHEYGNMKLDHLAAEAEDEEEDDTEWRTALVAPLNFIATTMTVIDLLYTPFQLHIIPYSVSKNPLKLQQYYAEHDINYSFLSPSLIRALKDHISPSLKLIFTGSEPANDTFVKGATLVNTYSMSEAAFTLCQFEIDHPYDVCPVGKPNSDLIQIHLLDEDGREAPDGETGEVCFEAPFFRGYINLPEETEKAFRDGLFHSGDLARKDENGNFVLLGRANDMFKINGNRIEPAEIEAAFKKLTGVSWCAARGFEKPSESFICLYYQGESLSMTDQELREGMSASLPYYMIPAHFIRIDGVPLLPNGKLNRRALPEPQISSHRAEYIAPRTELETKLCKAFEAVLHTERVGVTESFYDLGGSSLSAMEVLAIMDLDDLSAVEIFQGRTPERIARMYEEKTENVEGLSDEERELRARQSPHPLTPVLVNVIDFQLYSPKAPMWIFPFLFSFGPDADTERVLRAGRKLIEHQAIFSTVFEFGADGELCQRYDPFVRQPLNVEEMSDEAFKAFCQSGFEPFQLLGKPLVRLRMFKTPSSVYLLLVFHHAVMDGSSAQLFFNNLARAYADEPLVPDTYYSYLEDVEKQKNTTSWQEAYEYYKKNYEGIDWCDNIPQDRSEPGNANGTMPIKTDLTPAAMDEMEKNTGFSRNGFMVAAALLTLARISGNRNVMSTFTFHNRTDQRRMNAGGLIVATIPVGICLERCRTLNDMYEMIRKQSADGIASCAYDWISLRTNPFVNDVLPVVYETSSITGLEFLEKMKASLEPLDAHNQAALHLTMLQAFETEDGISVLLSYMKNAYSPEMIGRFAQTFTEVTSRLLAARDPKQVRLPDLLA